MESLSREKRTCDICKEKVEDEYHFLFECQVNKQLRDKFVNEMNTLVGDNFKTMNHFDETKLLVETTDKYILHMFGKYVYTSFEKHRKHTKSLKINSDISVKIGLINKHTISFQKYVYIVFYIVKEILLFGYS